jgi:hypothetical protein
MSTEAQQSAFNSAVSNPVFGYDSDIPQVKHSCCKIMLPICDCFLQMTWRWSRMPPLDFANQLQRNPSALYSNFVLAYITRVVRFKLRSIVCSISLLKRSSVSSFE